MSEPSTTKPLGEQLAEEAQQNLDSDFNDRIKSLPGMIRTAKNLKERHAVIKFNDQTFPKDLFKLEEPLGSHSQQLQAWAKQQKLTIKTWWDHGGYNDDGPSEAIGIIFYF
jgi:hypothetical protein